MLDKTLGYILCCQSPALFLAALALLVFGTVKAVLIWVI